MTEPWISILDILVAYILIGEVCGAIVAWQCGKWTKAEWLGGLAIVLILTFFWPILAVVRFHR